MNILFNFGWIHFHFHIYIYIYIYIYSTFLNWTKIFNESSNAETSYNITVLILYSGNFKPTLYIFHQDIEKIFPVNSQVSKEKKKRKKYAQKRFEILAISSGFSIWVVPWFKKRILSACLLVAKNSGGHELNEVIVLITTCKLYKKLHKDSINLAYHIHI